MPPDEVVVVVLPEDDEVLVDEDVEVDELVEVDEVTLPEVELDVEVEVETLPEVELEVLLDTLPDDELVEVTLPEEVEVDE